MADDRVTVPRGPRDPKSNPFKPEPVDLARILKALQTMEENAAARAKDLHLFLFFLPFIWGVVWGLVWFFIMMMLRN